MSEPFIRVYAADMRGDQKVAMLAPAERYMLIQAWDIAKNGPVLSEVRRADEQPMPPLMFAKLVDVPPAAARRFYERAVEFGLAELTEDGALRFVNLERRQGLDKTNAVRQKRFRDRRRNGTVTPVTVTPPVTGEVTPRNGVHAREPDPDTREERSFSQPVLVGAAHTRGPLTDNRIEIKDQLIPPSTRHAIERLLDALPDKDKGTAGVLVRLAQRGAAEGDYHDALSQLRQVQPQHPSRFACSHIRKRLNQRGAA